MRVFEPSRPIQNNSDLGEVVYDPFLGSGTTLIVAETTGLLSFGLGLIRLMSTFRCVAGRLSPAKKRPCSLTGVRSTRSKLNAVEDQIADMRGRRPKPTRMKLLTGNPGKRPMNKHEPKPEPVVPDCPNELSAMARREWDRLASELGKLNILTTLDRAALAAYCGAYALWAEATDAIRKFGTLVKSLSGYPIQSPWVSIANRQAEIMMRIASEFGFTPASRSRISTPVESQPICLRALKNRKRRGLPKLTRTYVA